MAAYDIPEIEADDQDRAEVMDETNLTGDGRDIANFDEIPDVYDATSALGDEDDEDEARDAADFGPDDETIDDDKDVDDRLDDDLEDRPDDDPDGFDDAADTRILPPDEEQGVEQVADAEHVEGGEDGFTDFESKRVSDADLKELGYAAASGGTGAAPEDVEDETDPDEEDRLEEALEETFPASDPVSAKHIT